MDVDGYRIGLNARQSQLSTRSINFTVAPPQHIWKIRNCGIFIKQINGSNCVKFFSWQKFGQMRFKAGATGRDILLFNYKIIPFNVSLPMHLLHKRMLQSNFPLSEYISKHFFHSTDRWINMIFSCIRMFNNTTSMVWFIYSTTVSIDWKRW